MDLREAVEKAQRILLEEQTKPTRRYKYAKETGVTHAMTNQSLMSLAAHATLARTGSNAREMYKKTPSSINLKASTSTCS
jgi:hypothetical protein